MIQVYKGQNRKALECIYKKPELSWDGASIKNKTLKKNKMSVARF